MKTVGHGAFHTTGATMRQIDVWTRRGHLLGTAPGQGRHREWPAIEVNVAALMVRLINAGFTVERAAQLARRHHTAAEVFVGLGDGLTLTIIHTHRPAAYAATPDDPDGAEDGAEYRGSPLATITLRDGLL